MLITYTIIPLATGGLNGARDIALGDQQVVQPVQLPRALATLFLARGNRATDFSFAVEQFFDTPADAEAWMLSHRGALPDSGDLYIACGEAGEVRTYWRLPAAVLQSVSFAAGALRGTSVLVAYRFQGGPFVPTDTETTYFPEENLTVKKGLITLASGIASQAVVFVTPFSNNPVVWVGLIPAAGQPAVGAGLTVAATINGFTAVFDVPLPAAGYILQWTAFQ